MPKKLKIKITKKQFEELCIYTQPHFEEMKRLPPNSWDTHLFVMAGIYEELFMRNGSFGMLGYYKLKSLPLSDIEWFILAHELLFYCPNEYLNDLLVKLDGLLLQTWNYSLDKFKKQQSITVDFFLNNIQINPTS
ncbi:MAG TPA: hypothetical protein VGE44_09435 [Daejeonella sp.]|uniref:hypothetical protein n=1 Tax=Daejeonella sp. TaxID=2805397 RepID=UPI002EDA2DD4